MSNTLWYTIPGGDELNTVDRDELLICENSVENEAAASGEALSHHYTELLFLLAGDCEVYIEEKLYKLRRNYMMIIPAGTKHRVSPGPLKCRDIAVCIPQSFINLALAADFGSILYKRAIKLDIGEVKFAKTMFDKIKDELSLDDKYAPELLKNLILEFFVRFLRTLQNNSAFEKEITLVDEIIAYLAEHYSEDLNQKSVAQKFYVSRSYLSKLFKAKTGRGFNEYLNKIRMEQAKTALKTTALPVTDIAFNCGFNDSNYFSKSFKKIEGVSPLNYRNG